MTSGHLSPYHFFVWKFLVPFHPLVNHHFPRKTLHFQSHIFSWILSPDPIGEVILNLGCLPCLPTESHHRIGQFPYHPYIYINNYPCSEGSSHMFSSIFLPQKKRPPPNRLPRRCPRRWGPSLLPKARLRRRNAGDRWPGWSTPEPLGRNPWTDHCEVTWEGIYLGDMIEI